MGGGTAVSSVVFVIVLRQLLRELAGILAPLVAGDFGAEAFAAGCPASPTPPRDRRRNRRIRHPRCSFNRFLPSYFLASFTLSFLPFLLPSLAPSARLPSPRLPRCWHDCI